jgi:hypothetical protein
MQKAAGITLILVGLLVYIIVFSATIQYCLFLAMVVSLPAFFVVLFGCSLILGGGFKRVILWCLLFTALTALPWTAILSLNYRVISYVLLVTFFILVLVGYRRKLKP